MKNWEAGPCRSLREIAAEVDAEMRGWGRQRLRGKLPAQTGQHGRVFPLHARPVWHARQQILARRAPVGEIKLQVWYGSSI